MNSRILYTSNLLNTLLLFLSFVSFSQCFSLDGYAIVTYNKTVKLAACDDNCKICSNTNTQICLECWDAFYINTSNNKCMRCLGNCKQCNQTNPAVCLSCFDYAHLQNDLCFVCNQNCLACESAKSLDKCVGCKQGYYLKDKKCIKGCSQNCMVCQDQNICTLCMQGYSIYNSSQNTSNSVSVICVQCTRGCQICYRQNPLICLKCSPGFFLNQKKTCTACKFGCSLCISQTRCLSCTYNVTYGTLTIELGCNQYCQFPCQSCNSQSPKLCTQCILGYKLEVSSRKCLPDPDYCGNNCSFCPYGYILENGTCTACGGNCQTCSINDKQKCYGCMKKYYLDFSDYKCKPCTVGCFQCSTQTICTQCDDGYTTTPSLIYNQGFSCLPCQGLCLTCDLNPKICTSCPKELVLKDSQCLKKFRYIIQIVLNIPIQTFKQKYYALFKNSLCNILSINKMQRLRIQSVKQGSTIVTSSIDPLQAQNSTQAAIQYKQIAQSISGIQQIQTLQVTSVSSSIDYSDSVKSQQTTSKSVPRFQNNQNVTIVVSVVFGLLGVIVIGFLGFFVIKKSISNSQQAQKKIQTDKNYNIQTQRMQSSKNIVTNSTL